MGRTEKELRDILAEELLNRRYTQTANYARDGGKQFLGPVEIALVDVALSAMRRVNSTPN